MRITRTFAGLTLFEAEVPVDVPLTHIELHTDRPHYRAGDTGAFGVATAFTDIPFNTVKVRALPLTNTGSIYMQDIVIAFEVPFLEMFCSCHFTLLRLAFQSFGKAQCCHVKSSQAKCTAEIFTECRAITTVAGEAARAGLQLCAHKIPSARPCKNGNVGSAGVACQRRARHTF